MSDDTNVGEFAAELSELQATATTARATADQLKSALTDQSSDEEKKLAEDAETTAVDAKKALADAQAEADAAAAANAAAATAAAGADAGISPDASASTNAGTESAATTASADTTVEPKVGDTCTCPDGRTGTVHKFDDGFSCIPNAEQS